MKVYFLMVDFCFFFFVVYFVLVFFFFFQAEDGIRDVAVTGVQTCTLPIFTLTAGVTYVAGIGILTELVGYAGRQRDREPVIVAGRVACRYDVGTVDHQRAGRSEERRVGKECRFRWWADDE